MNGVVVEENAPNNKVEQNDFEVTKKKRNLRKAENTYMEI